MKALIIILVVIAVALVAALLWMATQRKKDQQARLRADELRTQAAGVAHEHDAQAARAAEVEAEAQRARAQAQQLEDAARQERTAVDQTRAQQEDHLREADRLDPDVDHRADDYEPRLDTAAHPGQHDPSQARTGEHHVDTRADTHSGTRADTHSDTHPGGHTETHRGGHADGSPQTHADDASHDADGVPRQADPRDPSVGRHSG